ncbi:5-deoxy-glucuronate isomerase [Lactococcus termiticola]|uniref:5-deoxy-glucuronate isomerase n=1 Tax=Lactococcus termiticola TaxID=2169526 RepID=A0A2R5HG03_9LACT|nr:5-deoxy-glucuronate isomerase [Lactococcus termiticola]GBG96954.1 5-deoxy-glucuronate isomerase [Lactococcus termiticola]
MVVLKRTVIGFETDDKVKLLHHISKENSAFDWIEAQVFEMKAGGRFARQLDGYEACLVALAGQYKISDGEQTFDKVGTRESVFDKIPTDAVYIPAGKQISIEAKKAGKIIICMAPSKDKERKSQLISGAQNSIEHRGAFNNLRTVHNILDDESPISDKLLVVEVYTPSANWSSYPPHKHDQNNYPEETLLEEAYYHEMKGDGGFVFQRVYTDDGLIDETMTVQNEEMVLVPIGYHPVSVPDGYESYYLNIMAGPMKKWKFHNAKEHEWIIERNRKENDG